MASWPLPGGAVTDPASDQNFRAVSEKGGEVEGTLTKKVTAIEKEGLPASGKAGGVLKGEYPNPEFATAQATKAELENETSLRESKDATEKAARESGDATLTTADATEKSAREAADNERVKGPASAIESDIVVYNGTTGKIVKDGGKTIAETLARANHTGTQLAATVSDFDTQVRKSTLNQMTAPSEDLSVNSHKVTKVNEPTEGTDAANKTYVDTAASAAAAGLSIKNPVSYATTAALTATVEAEKTLEGNCPLEIDGKAAPAVAARLLLKTQASEKRNGLYEVTKEECFGGEGTFGGEKEFGVGSKWLLTRTADADGPGEVVQGMYVSVLLGATNGGSAWTQTTEGPIVIGTTAQTFSPYTAVPGGAAGGDLSGTYPNPMIKDIAYSKLNLAASITGTGDNAAGNRNYGIVEALPTSPTPAKGDVCRYKAAAGVYWDLVYTGEETYPWAYIGGASLVEELEVEQSTASTSYVNLTTVGPSITAPLKGDYDVTLAGSIFTSTANVESYMSFAVGATAAIDADALPFFGGAPGTPQAPVIAFSNRTVRKTAIAAASALTAKYRSGSATNNATFRRRQIRVLPVRVG